MGELWPLLTWAHRGVWADREVLVGPEGAPLSWQEVALLTINVAVLPSLAKARGRGRGRQPLCLRRRASLKPELVFAGEG